MIKPNNSLYLLDDKQLVDTFLLAKKLNLEMIFIQLLEEEIKKRALVL